MPTNSKTYILMHKDVPALKMSCCGIEPIAIDEVYAPEHVPLRALSSEGVDSGLLGDWLADRMMPLERFRPKDMGNVSALYLRQRYAGYHNCVSVSDHYWLKEPDETIT